MTAPLRKTDLAERIDPAAAAQLRATALDAQYRDEAALDILDAAINREFRGEIALVSSFGAESAVLLHLAAQVAPDVPVLFIDTGKHFAQTPIYRRQLAKDLGLTNVQDVRPTEQELTARDPAGDLWKKDTDACCTLRKVQPLSTALEGYGAWITGRKQFHGGERVHLPSFEFKGDHFKVNPIVRWDRNDIETYMTRHDLPRHPLTGQGFASIGCWPCTHPVAKGEDTRAGRWRGQSKTECGIHKIG